MSYWSTSLLGGPKALTALARIEDALDLPRAELYPLDALSAQRRRQLAARLDADFQPIHRAVKACGKADETIALQVAGAVLVALGARIPAAFRFRAAAAVRKDPYRRTPERRLEMDALARRLTNHRPGVPNAPGDDHLTVAMGRRWLKRNMPEPAQRGQTQHPERAAASR